MTTPGDAADTLVVRRVLPAPREQVFAAWLDPSSLARWMRPSGSADAIVEVDPRVGGSFRITMMHEPDGCEHRGEYLVIEPPSRLSFTWISAATNYTPSIVTIELHALGDSTELVLTHRRLPPDRIESHREGWIEIVRNLEEVVTAS
jgi:uncharacterized protein YndB with AHSA1/START domain